MSSFSGPNASMLARTLTVRKRGHSPRSFPRKARDVRVVAQLDILGEAARHASLKQLGHLRNQQRLTAREMQAAKVRDLSLEVSPDLGVLVPIEVA